MYEFIISVMGRFGYVGVFLLIAIENIFPPIPSEVILLFGGFMVTYTSLNLVLMVVFATLGSMLGSLVLYYLGTILNKERLKSMVSGKAGKVLKLKPDDIDRASNWFDTKGHIAVFIGRFFPIIRSLISVPAGMGRMNLFKFVLYTVLGSIVWNAVLLFLGYKVGENWEGIASSFEQYSVLVSVSITFFLILVICLFYYNRIKKERQGR